MTWKMIPMKKFAVAALSMLLVLSMIGCAFATTTGVGSVTEVTATSADGDAVGKVSITTTMCAVTLDDDGVIVGIRFDAVQPSASYDATGAVYGTVDASPLTKIEKGDDYNMKKFVPTAVGEWYEQAAALEAWCIGKTVDQVLAMQTYSKEDGEHFCVPNEPDLVSSCTIDVAAFQEALKKAADVAK